MNFKQWLYIESFELPFDNIRKIYEYYRESYEQYLKAPRTKIPPKLISLDLSGSKYDFLQYLNPSVDVYVSGSLPGASGIYGGMIKGNDGVVGKIYLQFSNFEHVNYSTVEHEVLHFVQDLIKAHVQHKDYIYGDLKKKRKPTLGGLPPMPLVKRLMKDREIDIDGNKKEKRTKHEYRPIEFYTNLNSLIRSLQYYYIILGIELGRGFIDNAKFLNFDVNNLEPTEKLLDWVSNRNSKKTFFKKLIDRKDHVVSDLEKVKDLDDELYKIYIKEIYKNFIDNDSFASNALEVKKIVDVMRVSHDNKEATKRNAQQKKEEKKEKLKDKVLLGNWTEADFAGRVTLTMYELDDFSDIYESDEIGYTNQEIAEEMFSAIGLKLNNKDEVVFGISAKNLTKIFNNIKKAKKTFSNTDIGKELDQEKINKNFDYMSHKMAETASRQMRINSWNRGTLRVPSAEDILNIFYL